MNQQTIPTSEAPDIIIEMVQGDLQVKGWERAEVEVKANLDELVFTEENDTVQLSCQGSCALRVPHGSNLRVENVEGEARFKLLEDQLEAARVGGAVILRNVADVSIDHVHGDLLVKNVEGEIRVGQVGGNASIREVDGDCYLEFVGGNLEARDIQGSLRAAAGGNASLRDLQGDCNLPNIGGNLDARDLAGSLKAKVGGNCNIRLDSVDGDLYEINASGALNCWLPEEASLQLSVTGARIRVSLPESTKTYDQGACEFTLGDGDAMMNLSAGGPVHIDAQESDWNNEEAGFQGGFPGIPSEDFNHQIAQQIEAQIEAQMDAINQQLSELGSLSATMRSAGLSPEATEEILQRARETGERAAEQAQEKMRRAQEKLERKLEAARRRGEIKAQAAERRAQAAEQKAHSRSRHSWKFEFSSPPKAQQPPSEPVSDEERLLILRMLEQRKITIEEAEALLSALEGNE